MLVQFKKGKNNKNTIRCHREDGTQEWCYASSLMDHDLAHFAVEKTLNLRNGLYGHLSRGVTFKLLASAGVTKAYSWHEEIFLSEILVNRVTQIIRYPEIKQDINKLIEQDCKEANPQIFAPLFSEDHLKHLVQAVEKIWLDWNHCVLGESLELNF